MRSLARAATVAAATLTLLAATAAAHADTTVHPGDTLWAIAGTACGDHGKWTTIWHDNPAISNPNLIFPGQRLRITCTAGPRTTGTASRSTRPASSGWSDPLPGSTCVSGWGAPRAGHSHKGIDLPAARGTAIHAAAAGTVYAISYERGGAGNYVVLNHGGGVFTVYMHLRSRTFLHLGARVNAGAVIGYVGDTGNPKPGAYHLHFEVHRGGLWYPHQINPAPWLRAHGVKVGC